MARVGEWLAEHLDEMKLARAEVHAIVTVEKLFPRSCAGRRASRRRTGAIPAPVKNNRRQRCDELKYRVSN